jgi:hypothetical protein
MENNDDSTFIKPPPLPKLPRIFNTIYIKIKKAVHKLPKKVKNGFNSGFIFALIPLLIWLFGKPMNPIILVSYMFAFFCIGTLLGVMFTVIAESMRDFSSYSRGQKTGIVIGFIGLFVFLAALLMYLDVKLFNNTFYQFLLGLYIYWTTLSTKMKYDIVESFKNGTDSVTNIKKPNIDFSSMKDCVKNNLALLIGAAAICIIMFFAARDTKGLTKNFNSYSMLMMIPIILGFVVLSPLFNSNSPHLIMFGGGILALIIAVAVYYTNKLSPDIAAFGSRAMGWLGLAIIIVGLAMAVKLFSNDLKQMTGWSGFFANLLFYIPCLLNDFIDYMFLQLKTTPNTVFLLFIVEILLILFFIYYPQLMNKMTTKNEANILKKPIFLNNRIVIANSDKMLMAIPKYDTASSLDKPRYNPNYTMDMWIHLNIQPSSSASYANETTIFDYGNGKPRISYKNSIGNSRVENADHYLIYVSNTGDDKPITISIPNQKWNYFAFNFLDSKVDVYINGALERSVEYGKNVPSYNSSDVISVGSDKGLDGAICNINYYGIPLTDTQIATKYNVLALQNPPF